MKKVIRMNEQLSSNKNPREDIISSSRKSSPKPLPNNHPSQKLFSAYYKVSRFVKNISKVYDSHIISTNDSVLVQKKRFENEEPKSNALVRPSFYPVSHLSNELALKFDLIHAYNNLSDSGKKKKPTCHKSLMRIKREKYDFSLTQKKFDNKQKTFISQVDEVETDHNKHIETPTFFKHLPRLGTENKKIFRTSHRLFSVMKTSRSKISNRLLL